MCQSWRINDRNTFRQLTSSASFLATVQAIAEPHTLFEQRAKMIETTTCNRNAKSQKKNIICTSEHHRATHRRECSSLAIKLSTLQRVLHNGRSLIALRQLNTGKQTVTRDIPVCWEENRPSTRKTFSQRIVATMLNNLGLRRQHDNKRVRAPKIL